VSLGVTAAQQLGEQISVLGKGIFNLAKPVTGSISSCPLVVSDRRKNEMKNQPAWLTSAARRSLCSKLGRALSAPHPGASGAEPRSEQEPAGWDAVG